MEIIEFNLNDIIEAKQDIVLCLGYFDAIHLGHQYLINKAKKYNSPIAILTFDKSPKYLLGKASESGGLNSLYDRVDVYNQLGVDYLYILEIDKDFLNLSRFEFVDQVIKKINPKAIVCGEDYRFGHEALGNPTYLSQYFDVEVVDLLKINNRKVSTKDIIDHIKNGKVELAKDLLGRPYRITGLVVTGKQNGRKIGFNTANLDLDYEYVLPKEGVYYGKVIIDDESYIAMISVGTHPTIMSLSKPIVEAHILNFDKEIYGYTISIDFLKYLRKIEAFSSLDDLKNQLQKDKEMVKTLSSKK